MLTAPLVAPAPSDAGSSSRPVSEEGSNDYAARRLQKTVWDRTGTVALYRVLLSVGGALARLGIPADALTLASVVLAVGAGVAVGYGAFVAAAGLITLSGVCDALDGAVARAAGTSSRYGALLDSTVDRLADGLPLLGVIAFYAESPLVLVPALAMMGAFLVSYVRARVEGLGGELPPLFMRRAERVVLLVLTLLVAPITVDAVPFDAPLLLLGVGLIGAMSFVGAASALRSAREALAAPRGGSVSAPSE